MDEENLAILNDYRQRIDNGDDLNASQLARYQALEAQEARLAQSKFSSHPYIFSIYSHNICNNCVVNLFLYHM